MIKLAAIFLQLLLLFSTLLLICLQANLNESEQNPLWQRQLTMLQIIHILYFVAIPFLHKIQNPKYILIIVFFVATLSSTSSLYIMFPREEQKLLKKMPNYHNTVWSHIETVYSFIFYFNMIFSLMITAFLGSFLAFDYIGDLKKWIRGHTTDGIMRKLQIGQVQIEDDCSICLTSLDNQAYSMCEISLCKHIFHSQCLVRWIQSSPVCPLCRTELPTPKPRAPRNLYYRFR